MAIPISKIVEINPRVIKAGSQELEIAGLFLSENELTPYPVLKAYASKDAVGEYYGLDSLEYAAASHYFQGYDNSFKKPSIIYFAKRVKEPLAGKLFGANCYSLQNLQKITSGGFTISVDGTPETVTGLDFSSAATYSDISALLAAKITGVTVVYNSNSNSLTITSNTTGANSAVSVATDGVTVPALNTDTATALGFTAASGALMSQGSAALTPTANMQAIANQSTNWVTFTTLTEATDDEIKEFAEWNNSNPVEFLYLPWQSSKALETNGEGTLVGDLQAANYEGFALHYAPNVYTSTLVQSIAASVDWDRQRGVVSYSLRKQTGLAASVTDDATATALLNNNVNFYGRYAARSTDFSLYYDAKMFSGNYGFIDTYINMIWLKNVMQISLVNGLTSIGRTPYNDIGYTQIYAWLNDPITRALRNGVIDAGVVLSESQKAQLYAEAGEDISTELFTNGYYIQVLDPGAAARVNRDSPIINVWYTYGGSVNRLVVPLTAVL